MFVDFYFTPYITAKHNNNNGMRHETVWVDHTIDSAFHQNESDGKRSSSSSYGRKVWHQSHFPPPFYFFSLLLLHLCLLLFITYYYSNDRIPNNIGFKLNKSIARRSTILLVQQQQQQQQHKHTHSNSNTAFEHDEGYRTMKSSKAVRQQQQQQQTRSNNTTLMARVTIQ